jgi:hypothetical protein
MPKVEPIREGMFPDIHREFLDSFDYELTRADWAPLFEIRPHSGQDHTGYALTDNGKLVGVLGMIFSERQLAGKTLPVCNLHTWMVKPEYRGHSLLLMRAPLKYKNHVVIDLSPTEGVQKISAKLGFKALDSTLCALLPTVLPVHENAIQACQQIDLLTSRILSPVDRQLFLDHSQAHMNHMVLETEEGPLYVIYSLVTRWRLNYCQIHYHNDDRLFEAHSDTIRHAIMQKTRCTFVAMHDRIARRMLLPRTLSLPIANRQLYLGNDEDAAHVDTLYTDISLLNLTSLGLKEIFRSLKVASTSWLDRPTNLAASL